MNLFAGPVQRRHLSESYILHIHSPSIMTHASDPPHALLLRYLYFLLEAIHNLPKEPEAIFYRGVGPDANEARLHCQPCSALLTQTHLP
jgi:hypothetical protein